MKDDVRTDVTARLKRITGQVSGIQRMVDEDRYCVDVLLQVAAAEAALDRVGHLVLGSHIETCVSSALESGNPRDRKKKMDELLEVFRDLRSAGVDILTLGQYLQPTDRQLDIFRYVTPAEFEELRQEGLRLGFRNVISGAMVRSSYHAWEVAEGA